jgi:hypothetical protein
MNKNRVKYLQGNNFMQLTLAEKGQVKNLPPATPNLVISHSSSSRIQTMWETLTLLYALNISGWVAVLKDTLYYALLINHSTILAPYLS